MTSGDRLGAPSASSAAAQSRVSATPGSLVSSTWRNRCTKPTTLCASRSSMPGSRAWTMAYSFSAVG